MTVAMGWAASPVEIAGLPCASCLFDLGDASGMAGAGPCPLKNALLRRFAEARRQAGPAFAAVCDGFAPGYAEPAHDWELSAAEAGLSRRLS
jgi:hypothetical protein